MRIRQLESSILEVIVQGRWKTCIELHIKLQWSDGEQGECVSGFGYAPVYRAIVRLEHCGYVESRERKVPGAVWPPTEYGITEAAMKFMDAWKDDI